jgi:hypothetical protein
MAWQLGTINQRSGRGTLWMAVTLLSACVGLLVLSCLFFFGGPIVLSVVAVMLAAIAVVTHAGAQDRNHGPDGH